MRNKPNRGPLPFGLMRLNQMINCTVNGLGSLCSQLTLEGTLVGQYAFGRSGSSDHAHELIDESTRERLSGWLLVADEVADEFEWSAVKNRIARFRKHLADDRTNFATIYHEIKALKEAIDDGLREQYIYRYPEKKAEVLRKWSSDWKTVIETFPGAVLDIRAGVDLWALGHSTASVFHMMRVLEYGLTGLANHVGKSYHTQVWNGIISEIEAAIKAEQNKRKGDDKQVRLRFLSEAAKELRYFKDGWRNYVSHNRSEYDDPQAQSVMEHTRQFMITLAAHLPAQDVAVSNQERDQIHDPQILHNAPERSQ